MRNISFLFYVFILMFFLSNCKKEVSDPLAELESKIRSKQDYRATQTYDQYEELLNELSGEKYIVVPIIDMIDTINNSKVVVGMRHDVDCHPFKALEMAQMENRHGFRTTYYFLATADYYGEFRNDEIFRFPCMEKIYKEIHNLGCEIGIHNDLIAIMILYNIDPFVFNRDEILFYKGLGIEIQGSVAHGSSIASETVPNFQIFSDFAESQYIVYKDKKYEIGKYSMSEFGFRYEANFINHNKSYTDSGGKWNMEGGFAKVMEELKNSKPGDRIQILAHPVWWGK